MSSDPQSQVRPMREFFLSLGCLTSVILLVLPLTIWWGNRFAGASGIESSLIAAGLCWLASLVALSIRILFPEPKNVVPATLGAMLARMTIVMGGALAASKVAPDLVEAGFWGQVVVFFLMTLLTETLLTVRWVKRLEGLAKAEKTQASVSLPNQCAKAV